MPIESDIRAKLDAQVKALPTKPGVYIFRNTQAQVIYVGKASNLRSRVRSYFGSPRSLEGKTRILVGKIAELEHIVTNTEQDALHLEATLCKRHQPFFNVRLKDDKHYPYLKVDVTEAWPRVYITRRVERDGARYFGPYANAKSVRTTLDLVKKLFPWRSCTKTITGTDPRPCLDYYINRCIAPCTSYCTPDEYAEVVNNVVMFLEGRTDAVVRDLKRQMLTSAEGLEFERAAQIRDQLAAVERVTESQVTARVEHADIDIFGIAQDGDEAVVQVFFVRGQKMTGRDHFVLAGTKEETVEIVVGAFLKQFYESSPMVPRLILIPHEIEEHALVQDWLSSKRGSQVEVRVPERGEKRRLVAMANDNATESLQMLRVKWMADAGKTSAALEELQEALNLPAIPGRIECYDISNVQGTNSVASMVVFIDGQPATREYRRFKIKTVQGANDFASMAEVLQRRFKRLAREREEAREQEPEAAEHREIPAEILGPIMSTDDDVESNVGGIEVADDSVSSLSGDAEDHTTGMEAMVAAAETRTAHVRSKEGWEAAPDLVIVDGGKGQLSAAHDILRNLGVDDVPLAGLAKREEELFVVESRDPIRLDRRSQGLYLVQRIRDEAHRFAITYHRNLRGRRSLESPLDSVAGIGPKKKKVLLRKFGSLKGLREASVEEIAATPGLTRKLADAIKGGI
jgi:excinuclease ABC subunit C